MEPVTVENYPRLAHRSAMVLGCNDALLHGALGLLTEVSELNEANIDLKDRDYILKELGDILWFCVYIHRTATGNDMEISGAVAPIERQFSGELALMLREAGEVGTAIKAFVFYNRTYNQHKLTDRLHAIVQSVYQMANGFSSSIEQVMEMNITKLRLRYPYKYNDADANERKDEGAATTAYTNQG